MGAGDDDDLVHGASPYALEDAGEKESLLRRAKTRGRTRCEDDGGDHRASVSDAPEGVCVASPASRRWMPKKRATPSLPRPTGTSISSANRRDATQALPLGLLAIAARRLGGRADRGTGPCDEDPRDLDLVRRPG